MDDAVRARKALNGRDVLGSDVGAIRIGFARVPVKNAAGEGVDEGMGVGVQGVGDLSVGATIHALRTVKGASTIPADQQVLGGSIENYRSNLLLSMIGSGTHQALGNNAANNASRNPTITEQQMVMLELSGGAADAEADIKALGGVYILVLRLDKLSDYLCRIPSSYHVLLDHSTCCRAPS